MCEVRVAHHGSDLIVALQELNNLGLVGRLDTGEAASPGHGFTLLSKPYRIIKSPNTGMKIVFGGARLNCIS